MYRALMQRRFERRRRLALALLAVAALTVAAPACVRTSWPHTSGRYVGTTVSDARFARLRRGVNLSHWFAQLAPDSARVDVTSGDVTRADLEKIRALGFGHVRFGVDPEPMYDERDPSHIDGPYLASLDRAVDAILDADLAVVIAMHPTEGGSFKKRLEDDDAHVARVARFWEALARHFAARDPDRLFLEVLNENEVGDRGRWE
ncbi:MAG TPA: cellulase family glycosylhydrolase, partial [Gemmatimonadaceae bacterium]|nr:cellulase family glycosylhydrolase [Gemmatimonadaceae bacterium]